MQSGYILIVNLVPGGRSVVKDEKVRNKDNLALTCIRKYEYIKSPQSHEVYMEKMQIHEMQIQIYKM